MIQKHQSRLQAAALVLFLFLSTGSTPQENLSTSTEDSTPLFKIPAGFHRVSQEELLEGPFRKIIQTHLPDAKALWFHPESKVKILAGITPLVPQEFQKITAAQFQTELENTGRRFSETSKTGSGTQANYEITEESGIFKLVTRNHFVEEGQRMAGHRYIFFYAPDHRLNLFITGTEEALQALEPMLQQSIADFEASLQAKFPKGLSFASEKSKKHAA